MRIQQKLGYYDGGIVAEEEVKRWQNVPFKDASLLPLDSQSWGSTNWLQWDHVRVLTVLGVICAVLAFELARSWNRV